jgi:hypothetical protein
MQDLLDRDVQLFLMRPGPENEFFCFRHQTFLPNPRSCMLT